MIFFHSTRNELIKIALKPRSYLGLAAITGLVGIILFALVADGMTVISFVTASFEQTLRFEGKVLNGNLVAFIILQMLIIQIPLLVALVTGDLISGEAAMGTLRMLLTKPITRTQLLMSKFLAGGIYTFLIVLWLGFMAVGIGQVSLWTRRFNGFKFGRTGYFTGRRYYVEVYLRLLCCISRLIHHQFFVHLPFLLFRQFHWAHCRHDGYHLVFYDH